ncbi:hypothetical protein C808_00326 [Lachnospiraceae bacterium M18-1]|nr:hypothetical protein C808_00326 [Lachnospiraceae bacterium M18-1]
MDVCFLETVYDIFEIPLVVVQEDSAVCQIPDNGASTLSFSKERELFDELVRFFRRREGSPAIYMENEYIYFGGFSDPENLRCYIWGPITRKDLDQHERRAYYHIHNSATGMEIKKCGTDHVSKMLAMVYYVETGKKTGHIEIPFESGNLRFDHWNSEEKMEHYQLEQSEEERGHNSVDYENELLRIVKSGDVAAMKNLMNIEPMESDEIGVVAVNSHKRMEYLVVAMITLISRAAIESGVNPEKSYELSDIYMQRLEKCRNAAEINIVGGKAQLAFTQLVQDEKKYRSTVVCVERCKDYIAKHLRKDFRVGDIAPAIGVSRVYLTRKFSETEGMTIQQYIMQERCSHAANLLKYSDYPISIISEYFCFSSQSHFGVQFKKIYGMTPNEYRNRNRYIESYGSGSQDGA